MKFFPVAAIAASLVGAAPLSSEIESLLELTTEQVVDFEVATLGGMTLRAEQMRNENFIAAGRGPRAYLQSLRKFSQFGATIDPALICIVDSILQDLGLGSLIGADGAAANCSTSTTGGGLGGGQSGNPSGQPSGGRPGGSNAPNGTGAGNATSTGASQGTSTPDISCAKYVLIPSQGRLLPYHKWVMSSIFHLCRSERRRRR